MSTMMDAVVVYLKGISEKLACILQSDITVSLDIVDVYGEGMSGMMSDWDYQKDADDTV